MLYEEKRSLWEKKTFLKEVSGLQACDWYQISWYMKKQTILKRVVDSQAYHTCLFTVDIKVIHSLCKETKLFLKK